MLWRIMASINVSMTLIYCVQVSFKQFALTVGNHGAWTIAGVGDINNIVRPFRSEDAVQG